MGTRVRSPRAGQTSSCLAAAGLASSSEVHELLRDLGALAVIRTMKGTEITREAESLRPAYFQLAGHLHLVVNRSLQLHRKQTCTNVTTRRSPTQGVPITPSPLDCYSRSSPGGHGLLLLPLQSLLVRVLPHSPQLGSC